MVTPQLAHDSIYFWVWGSVTMSPLCSSATTIFFFNVAPTAEIYTIRWEW